MHILSLFEVEYGAAGACAIGRCPAQMNLIGMHLDYGGMPSLRLAIKGLETVTLARPRQDGTVRIRSVVESGGTDPEFPPAQFDLEQCIPDDRVATPERFKRYAVGVCNARSTTDDLTSQWELLPLGVLIFLESYFRDIRPIKGLDLLVWSNVPPIGGMSSSSALVVSIAIACMAAQGWDPWVELDMGELIDGIGSSEWLCGTRGGTADHGTMIYAEKDALVCIGALPTRNLGQTAMPSNYAAVVFDSGVERIYDDIRKQESAAAYPLSLFLIRHVILPGLLNEPAFAGITPGATQAILDLGDLFGELDLGLEAIYTLLLQLPRETTLAKIERRARQAGAQSAFRGFFEEAIRDPFPAIGFDTPLYLRRRTLFGIDRVIKSFAFLRDGNVKRVLDLIRISHRGEGDVDVTNEEIEDLMERSHLGPDECALCYQPGGYGRMTPAYDRVAAKVNAFLGCSAGNSAGAVQRLGAGWGGSIGGLVERSSIPALGRYLEEDLGIQIPASGLGVVPGSGAGTIRPS